MMSFDYDVSYMSMCNNITSFDVDIRERPRERDDRSQTMPNYLQAENSYIFSI